MALGIGIVGLPNVGKSTTFNALTKAQNAEAANYPFCTIEPNKAIVPVPDRRLNEVAKLAKSAQVLPATVEFVDIAGLVKGASKGEGLGNQFLGHIRETAAIVQIVRCFEDENVVHVHGAPDPRTDIDVIETELILADVQTLEKRIERLNKQVRGDKKAQPVLDCAHAVMGHLEQGKLVNSFQPENEDAFIELIRETPFMTAKTMIYCANVDENGLSEDNEYVEQVKQIAAERGAEFVKICAKVEEEMAGMTDAERDEFLQSLGAEESGLHQVIHHGYAALNLASYFTAGPKEARAWTVERGSKAPQAAGVIHTDFERNFIRAEVTSFDDYIKSGGEAGAKAAGLMRVEGKDYIVKDGDVIYFRVGG